MAEPADDLLGLMDQVMAAWVALDHAHQQAQAAGRIERAISLNLVLRSVGTAPWPWPSCWSRRAPRTSPAWSQGWAPAAGGRVGGEELVARR
jgi:hypothetical protein